MFDQAVLRAANSAMTAAQQQGDAGLSSDLRAKIEGYGKEGSAERFELMDMFGQQAFASLTEMDNPYIQDIQSDPMLFDYSFVRIANEEEYNALPSGTRYLHPDGSVKRKM